MYSCSSRSVKIQPSMPTDEAAKSFFPSLRVSSLTRSCTKQRLAMPSAPQSAQRTKVGASTSVRTIRSNVLMNSSSSSSFASVLVTTSTRGLSAWILGAAASTLYPSNQHQLPPSHPAFPSTHLRPDVVLAEEEVSSEVLPSYVLVVQKRHGPNTCEDDVLRDLGG